MIDPNIALWASLCESEDGSIKDSEEMKDNQMTEDMKSLFLKVKVFAKEFAKNVGIVFGSMKKYTKDKKFLEGLYKKFDEKNPEEILTNEERLVAVSFVATNYASDKMMETAKKICDKKPLDSNELELVKGLIQNAIDFA